MTKIVKPFVRDPYNYDKDEVSNETGLKCEDPSLAQQHMKDECDINVIVERFGVTGQLPVTTLQPTYGDFSGVSDYQDALIKLQQTDADFMALPAAIRARFANDPFELVNFLASEANREEAIQLGLIDGQPVVEPIVSAVETPKDAA
jgi:phage internal scaffolding protein